MLERVQLYGTAAGAARGSYDVYKRNNYGYGAAVVKPTVWLTPEKFAQWLVENQVVEVCLGERVNGKVFDVHLESLKRLTTIVAFLAEQQVLTVAHVQRLWKSTWRVFGWHFRLAVRFRFFMGVQLPWNPAIPTNVLCSTSSPPPQSPCLSSTSMRCSSL
jgi:hypothetical protein